MTRARLAALLSVALLLSVSAGARASAETILLVVDPRSMGTSRRVEAELTAAGFTIVTRTSLGPADRRALLEDARQADAVATVRVHASGAGAELWIIDRVTGKTVFRAIEADEATDDAVLATKATELLRASLLEVRAPGFRAAEVPVPVAAEALLPPAPPSPPAPEPRRGFVGIGGAVGWGGPLGALGFVTPELRVQLSSRVAVGAALAIPVTQSSFQAPQGSSSQLVSHGTLVLDMAPLGFAPRVAPFVGAAAGVLWFHASGTANAPYTSEVANVFAAALGARAGAAFRITESLALRAQITTLVSLPQPVVIYAGRAEGALAEPLVEGALLLELPAW